MKGGYGTLCPGTVHIAVYCDNALVDGTYTVALSTSDSTDIIEYTTSPPIQSQCQLVATVSNEYINETISKHFSK